VEVIPCVIQKKKRQSLTAKKSGVNFLEYDLEWLAIIRLLHKYFGKNVNDVDYGNYIQNLKKSENREIENEMKVVKELLKDDFKIPVNFCHNVDVIYNAKSGLDIFKQEKFKLSEQTKVFLKKIANG